MTTPTPEVSTAPTPEGTAAGQNAFTENELRELAQELYKLGKLPFEPATLIKGDITSVSVTSAAGAPSVGLTLSGSNAEVSGVSFLSNFTPRVGMTVLIAKQGADLFVIGNLSTAAANGSANGGWIKATLTNGAHDGNGNGDVEYRRILDHGSWKMQWRGGWDTSGTMMIGTGDALPTDYRPSSKRSLVAAREIQTGATAVQFDFHVDGRVELVGGTTAPASTTATGTNEVVDPPDETNAVVATGSISNTVATGTISTEDPIDQTTSVTATGSISTEDPIDNTTSTSITVSGTTSTEDPGDSTNSVTVTISGTTSTVDPIDETNSAGDPAHVHSVLGSHNHTFSGSDSHSHSVLGSHNHTWSDTVSHSHGVTGSHNHTFTGNSHSHGVTGSHDHTFTGNSHGHTFTGNSHFHSVLGEHTHAFTGNPHAHAVTAPGWVSLNGLEYFL